MAVRAVAAPEALIVGAWVLGRYEVRIGSRPVARAEWQRLSAERLVKLLLVTRGHSLTREAATELLWRRVDVARQAALRFLRHFGLADAGFLDAHLDAGLLPPQRAIEVTHVVTIETDRFAFTMPVAGLDVVAQGGTLLAHDGEREVRTPYDECVLIMPTRKPRKGETAVRLGRFVA